MLSVTGLVAPVSMSGERPTKSCVGVFFYFSCSVLQLLHELLLFIALHSSVIEVR